MKKIVNVLIAIVILISGISIGVFYKSNGNVDDNKGLHVRKNFSNKLSMMLENEEGKYVSTTAEEWPTTGYKFNSKLSKCANGGKVYWDYKNKLVKMEGVSSDKCFIYFDKIVTVDSYCDSGDNLADCIKTFGNQGYDKSSIYIHNSSLANGAADGSYRFAGASDYVNNFVCFGSDAEICPTDSLYRIIGVFGDKVKLIKWDYATSALLGNNYSYSSWYPSKNNYITYKGSLNNIYTYRWSRQGTNVWSESDFNIYNLNSNFINNIGTDWSSRIDTVTWQVGGLDDNVIIKELPSVVYDFEINNSNSISFTSKIGLMYVSDYLYSSSNIYWNYRAVDVNGVFIDGEWTGLDYASSVNNNWLYMGFHDWTITSRTDLNNYSYYIFNTGFVSSANLSTTAAGVRPSFYLKSSIKYDCGKGTKDNPIRLS